MQILITNEQRRVKLDIKKIERLIRRILKMLRLPSKSSLSVTFLSRAKIRQFNKRYFRRNRATDVIAFGYSSRPRGGSYPNYLGDMVICPGVALENSKIYHNDFFSELTLCIIHGILHLQGYTDRTRSKRLKMQKTQAEVLGTVLEHGYSCSRTVPEAK